VIVGLRRGDGRWLMIRRSRHVAAPLKISFPGGALEPGEQREACAVREVREELGIDIRLGEMVWSHDFDDKPLTLWGYLGHFNGSAAGHDPIHLAPDPYEVAEVLWLNVEELAEHPDVLPASEDFVAHLEAALKPGDHHPRVPVR
jgi:mutator protein MutT